MADNINDEANSQLITFTITLITVIIHDLHLICSFMISYPLYFSYVIYFFPYVIKLISFISPIFIATVFLSILITTTMTKFCDNLNQLKLGIVRFVVQMMKWNLDCGISDGFDFDFEEFEIYKVVFDCEFWIMICDRCDGLGFEKLLECSVYGDRRSDVADFDSDLKKLGFERIREISAHGCRKSDVASSDSDVVELGSVHGCRNSDVASSESDVDKSGSVHGCRKSDVASSESDEDQLCSVHCYQKDDVATSNSDVDKSTLVEGCRKKDVASSDSDVDKLSSVYFGRKNDVAICNSEMNKSGIEKLIEELDKFEDFTAVKRVTNGSETISSITHEKLSENSVKSRSSKSNSPSIVSSHGSMREDNEWRKTLACKLFEERHNSLGGEEGMDSLWETHETNNSKNQTKNSTRSISFNTSGTDTDTDSDEPVMGNGHLCCLQALKLSTGKMNLGMGKPNIVKITKAFKGFGWLNYVKKKKHGKKSWGNF